VSEEKEQIEQLDPWDAQVRDWSVPDHLLSAQQRFDRDKIRTRKAMWIAFWTHVVVVVILLIGWRAHPDGQSPYAAAGPRAGDNFAASGGAMQAMQLQIFQTQPIPRPPRPLEVTMDIEPEPMEFEEEPQELSEILGDTPGSSADAGEGDDQGPGLEEGDGMGDGGTAAEGRFRLMPPVPRGMIMPPTNDNLRGKEVEVWVFVDATGAVVPDSTYLVPPTKDRGFNERLVDEAAEWVFRPATKAGEPVGAWFPYKISM